MGIIIVGYVVFFGLVAFILSGAFVALGGWLLFKARCKPIMIGVFVILCLLLIALSYSSTSYLSELWGFSFMGSDEDLNSVINDLSRKAVIYAASPGLSIFISSLIIRVVKLLTGNASLFHSD